MINSTTPPDAPQDAKPSPRTKSATAAAQRMRRLRERRRQGITLYTLTPTADWRSAMVRLGMCTEAESRVKTRVEAKLTELVGMTLTKLIRDQFSR